MSLLLFKHMQAFLPPCLPTNLLPFISVVTISRAFLFDSFIMKFTKGRTEWFSRGSLTDYVHLNYFN